MKAAQKSRSHTTASWSFWTTQLFFFEKSSHT